MRTNSTDQTSRGRPPRRRIQEERAIMQRRIEVHSRAALWIERLVWNAAAAAALAVMILVLLGSLRWLDELAPRTATADTPPVSAAAAPDDAEPAAVGVNRPSG